jgi:microsomal dipeptidase-like Zn-dependent dipeptidase
VRRLVVSLLAVLVFLLVAARSFGPGLIDGSVNVVEGHDPWPVSDAARRLHDTLVVGDLHADTLLWSRDPLVRATRGHVDIPRLDEAGYAVQVFATVTKVPRGLNYESNTGESDIVTWLALVQGWPRATWRSFTERALYQAARLHDVARRAPERVRIVRGRDDLDDVLARRAGGERLLAALLATEGSHALDGDVANVARLHEAGFRMMGLHHFFDNELGGSLHGTAKSGLTPFGREVVDEMVRLGILIDVAHSSAAVVDDVLAMTDVPLVVSHTGVLGACDTPRNLPDDSMRRIVARGGLLGGGFWDAAVCDTTPAGVARAIRAAVDLVGIDHVALGSDYDGATTVRFDAAELPALTQALVVAGFSDAEIRQVMGGNLVRYLRANLRENDRR